MPRPLSEEAREKAVQATQALVAECGIDGFTIDGVARRSGVAKTTLYRHFSSANELLVHALDCQVQHIPTPDTGSLVGDLTAQLSTMRDIVNTPGNRRLFIDMAAASAGDPELDAVKLAMINERTRPIREIVRRAVERGEIPETDIARSVVLVEGPFIARMLMSAEPITEDEVEAYVAHAVRGLGAAVDA